MSRRNPFDDIEEFFDQLNDQFQGQPGFGGPAGMGGQNHMSIDLADHDGEFVVTADAPGYDKDDISVRASDDAVHIEAESEGRSQEGDETYIRSERHSQSMRRSIRLPEPVNEDEVSATYKNGVLTITLPKREPGSGGKSIEIE